MIPRMTKTTLVRRGGNPGYPPDKKQKIMDHVLTQLAHGRALTRILSDDEGMPSISAVFEWQREDPFIAQEIARARELGVEVLLDETLEIADETNADAYIERDKDGQPFAKIDGEAIQRSKLKIETRHKYAQMIAPRKYGAKIDVTSGGEKLAAPPATVMIDARMQSLVAIAQRRADAQTDPEDTPLIDLDPSPSIEDLMS
jgi:vancomycin resistance protein YoaR